MAMLTAIRSRIQYLEKGRSDLHDSASMVDVEVPRDGGEASDRTRSREDGDA